ncbi:MAG TPA: O-antigen ligase family protein [Planctomycetota bacterium]|nr:O-antigen ligase family protein [Planctomycetota bacterium]
MSVHPRLRALVGSMLLALLGGYLIFNRPFAQLGLPPLYIGEMILALCILTSLERIPSALIQPLRRSWTFRLIALFMSYCLLRGVIDFFSSGFWALRDCVIGGYAIFAFIAPAVLAARDPVVDSADGREAIDELPSTLTRLLLPVTLAAAMWAASVHYGWLVNEWTETKVDFIALAATTSAWVWLLAALKMSSRPAAAPGERQTAWLSSERGIACLAAAALALLCALLVRQLPTRAMYLTLGPLALLGFAVWACTRARFTFFAAAAGLAIVACSAIVLPRIAGTFSRLSGEYALSQNLERSLAAIELSTAGETYTKIQLKAGTASGDAKAKKERIAAIFSPDEKFETSEGKLAAHAIQWRAIFWMRCAHYTLQRAPLLGVGFGKNLTNLLRDTPAWPMYVDSMRVDPPNRSPHSVHVTLLTRLGIPGLLLWLAILALVLYDGLRACWSQLRRSAAHGDGARALARSALHRARFFDTLTVLGVWVIFIWAASFGVILEGPMGGIWFWSLTGVLAWQALALQAKND